MDLKWVCYTASCNLGPAPFKVGFVSRRISYNRCSPIGYLSKTDPDDVRFHPFNRFNPTHSIVSPANLRRLQVDRSMVLTHRGSAAEMKRLAIDTRYAFPAWKKVAEDRSLAERRTSQVNPKVATAMAPTTGYKRAVVNRPRE